MKTKRRYVFSTRFTEKYFDNEGGLCEDCPDLQEKLSVLADDITNEFNKCFEWPAGYSLVLFGTLGLWNGKPRVAAHMLSFFSCDWFDACDIYFEHGNLYQRVTHHDGTNHYLYRWVRSDKVDHVMNLWSQGKNISKFSKPIEPTVIAYYGNRYGGPTKVL